MVAWSRLVADESAITTDATSATHLRRVYEGSAKECTDMGDVVTRVACQHLEDSKSQPVRRAESAHRHKSTLTSAYHWIHADACDLTTVFTRIDPYIYISKSLRLGFDLDVDHAARR
jgi:hypothetical protein